MIFGEHLDSMDSAPAVVDESGKRTWTYADLRAVVTSLSAALKLDRKALVFCFCRNDFASLAGYLSSLHAGHAVCLLDSAAAFPLKRQLVALYRPDFIFDSVPTGWEEDGFVSSPSTLPGVRLWKSGTTSDRTIHPDLALLLSTSGTTGSPKLVRLSRRNVHSNADAIRKYLALGPGEKAITTLPMQYSYGLSVVNSHLISGACLVLTQHSVIRPEFWEVFNEQRCTSFAGVPYSYQMLLRIGFERFHLPSLRTMTQAGGKMDKALIQRFAAWAKEGNRRLMVMYGQTEATARISYVPEDRLAEKLGAVGRPIEGGVLSIMDGERSVTTHGVVGEIVYRGDNVMMGYATSPADLEKGDVQGGVLRTGDLGYFDEEGFFFVTGRLRRFSKIYGLRISLDEVEDHLRPHGPVAVIGTDERIIAFCEQGDEGQFAAFRRLLGGIYSLNQNSFEFRRVARLPLTSTGKIDYESLRGITEDGPRGSPTLPAIQP